MDNVSFPFTSHPYTISTAERSPPVDSTCVHVYMYTAGVHTPMRYLKPSDCVYV